MAKLLGKAAQREVDKSKRMLRAANTIMRIVDNVETRCLAVDGPVTSTLQEITEAEMTRIWHAAKRIVDNA